MEKRIIIIIYTVTSVGIPTYTRTRWIIYTTDCLEDIRLVFIQRVSESSFGVYFLSCVFVVLHDHRGAYVFPGQITATGRGCPSIFVIIDEAPLLIIIIIIIITIRYDTSPARVSLRSRARKSRLRRKSTVPRKLRTST